MTDAQQPNNPSQKLTMRGVKILMTGRITEFPPRARVGLMLLSAMCLILTSGCPKSGSTPKADSPAAPFAGTEVRMVLPADLKLVSAWTPGLEDWAAEAAASYSISEVDFAMSNSENDEWLTTLKSASPTLVLLPTPLVRRR